MARYIKNGEGHISMTPKDFRASDLVTQSNGHFDDESWGKLKMDLSESRLRPPLPQNSPLLLESQTGTYT